MWQPFFEKKRSWGRFFEIKVLYLRKCVNFERKIEMKKFLKDKKVLYIIAIVVLAVVLCVSLAMCGTKDKNPAPQTQEEEEETDGLKVEENADDVEGDSVDFSEFDNKYEVDDKGNVVDKTTGDKVPGLEVDKDGNIVDSGTGNVVQPSKPSTDSGNTNSGSGEGFGTLF